MWLFTPDSFLSIVKDKDNDEYFLVRARIKGDIEKWFPGYKVEVDAGSDYKYRARVMNYAVLSNIAIFIQENLKYSNFKDTNTEPARNKYLFQVWHAMADAQDEAQEAEDYDDYLN